MKSTEHTKYRQSKEWREFRKSIVESQKAICVCCGTKYSGKQSRRLQLHHLDPDNYTDLNPAKFALVCGSCHDLIERFVIKLKGKNSKNIPNLENWVRLLYAYLPYSSRAILIDQYDEYLLQAMPDRWLHLKLMQILDKQ